MKLEYIFLLILFFCVTLHSVAGFHLQKKDYSVFFVWMGEGKDYSNERLEKNFKKLRDAGVDGIMYMCSADRYPEVIRIAKQAGLELHAWQVILNCRDEKVMEVHVDCIYLAFPLMNCQRPSTAPLMEEQTEFVCLAPME